MRNLIYRFTLPASLLAAVAAIPATPSEAQACGGTFCDQGPTAMPVEQTGENILFVLDDGHVEAHIQIQYDPETNAEEFAWLIPVQAVPEFHVSSERLFQNLLQGSVPTYGLQTTIEPCGGDGDGDGAGDGDGDGDGTGDGDGDGDGDGEPPPPEIVEHKFVGAFEIHVLQGGTAETVMQWLGDNGYQQDPNAEPIIGEYIEEEFLFVAMKLATDEEVASIHPIRLDIEGDEPCVPLRLTRIAAKQDMEVRTFFLGDARTVPFNYRHVTVNPLKIDWMNNANNYMEVVAMAVDAEHADGRAFVTEYAGPSATVSSSGLVQAAWDAEAFLELSEPPIGVIEELTSQGLIQCFPEVGCNYGHDLLPPLLAQYIPVPEQVDEGSFYDCLECFEGLIDQEAWDAEEFSAELDARIIAPGEHAVELLETWPHLSRLYTTISPWEMTEDPVFIENPDLPDVEQVRIADQTILCEGGAMVVLPDGREVYLPTPFQWPDFPDEMPWEMTVELGTPNGPTQVLVDQCIEAGNMLELWNRSHGVGADAYGFRCEDPDGDPGGSPWDGGEEGEAAGGEDDVDAEGRGCGCVVEPSDSWTAALALLLLPLVRRRRRRRDA